MASLRSRKRKGHESSKEPVSKKQSRIEETTEGQKSKELKWRKAGQVLTKKLQEIFFHPYKLQEEKTAFGRTFSDGPVRFQRMKESDTSLVEFRFTTLFDCRDVKVPILECNMLSSPSSVSESSMFYDVVTNFLKDLGRITLNPDYKRFVDEYVPSSGSGSSEGVPDSTECRVICGPIGIGNRTLWWGQPDACVRPVSTDDIKDEIMIVATNPDQTNSETDNSDSDSDTDAESSQFEAKCTKAHLPQAVATAVVHSFTQSGRHPTLNPMVPTVLIDGTEFRVILYDCVKDVLLVSSCVKYRDGSRITELGTLTLSLVINHRKFLLQIDEDGYTFGLKQYAQKCNLLDSFKELNKTCRDWKRKKADDSPDKASVIKPLKMKNPRAK